MEICQNIVNNFFCSTNGTGWPKNKLPLYMLINSKVKQMRGK